MSTIITLAGIAFVVIGCVGIALGRRMYGEDSAARVELRAEPAAKGWGRYKEIGSNTNAPITVMGGTAFLVRNETGATQHAIVRWKDASSFSEQLVIPAGQFSEVRHSLVGCTVELSAASPELSVLKL